MQMLYIFSCNSNIFQIQYYFVVSYVIKKEMSSVIRFICVYKWILYRLQAIKTQDACVWARSLSLNTVLTLACLSPTKTKHDLLMFAAEVVRSTLEGWLRGEIKCMPFAIPKICTNHLNGYFCMVDVSHYRKSKDKRSIVYPSIPSSNAPLPHCDDLPIPEPLTLELPSCASISSEEDTDADFCEASTSEESTSNQQEIDLIRDMGLTKENAQLLTSRLKECNLLGPTCKVSKYRKRHLSFARFFTVSQPHSLCYCSRHIWSF